MSRPKPLRGHLYEKYGKGQCPSCPLGGYKSMSCRQPSLYECACGLKGCVDCLTEHLRAVRNRESPAFGGGIKKHAKNCEHWSCFPTARTFAALTLSTVDGYTVVDFEKAKETLTDLVRNIGAENFKALAESAAMEAGAVT